MSTRAQAYVTIENLEHKAATWLAFLRATVAPRPRLSLDPSHSALLVIDMVRHFLDSAGRAFLPAAPAIVPKVVALVEAYRQLNAPIAFTQHGHRGPNDLGMFGKFYSDILLHDEPEADIAAPLAPHREDVVFLKSSYDAFLGTTLESYLNGRGVTQLVVVGVLTHRCCETTARSAFCRGFEVYVPVDAMATTQEDRHWASLLSMADSCAVPMSTAEVIAACLAQTR